MVIFRSSQPTVNVPHTDIYAHVFDSNKFNQSRSQDKPLLIDGLSGKSLSYAQVKDLSDRIAAGWKEKVKLSKGDVVAVFAPNQYDHAVLYLSLLGAQCIVTPG